MHSANRNVAYQLGGWPFSERRGAKFEREASSSKLVRLLASVNRRALLRASGRRLGLAYGET